MISLLSFPEYIKNWQKHFFGNNNYIYVNEGTKFLIRPRTHDLYTISEVFKKASYAPTIYPKDRKIMTILDLGANIGAFSLWAAKTYPKARIVALEIARSSYEMLVSNINLNKLEKRIFPVHKAIYSKNVNVGVKTPILAKGSIDMLSEKVGNTKVKGVTLKKIMEDFKIKKVDYLKMDVEGSEKFVLTEENKNIFRTKIQFVYMEAHKLLGYNYKEAPRYFSKLGFETKIKRELHSVPTLLIEAFNKNLER